MSCICGETTPHIISRKVTNDGIHVVLWSNGQITGALGYALKDVPIARPRTQEAMALALRAGWLFLGEVCLWGSDELSDLYKACRQVAIHDGNPGDVRAKAAQESKQTILLKWITIRTDRDGKPKYRWATLPRLRWPGLCVLDFCGSDDSKGHRYQVHTIKHESKHGGEITVSDTGFHFKNLNGLSDYLLSIDAMKS